MHTQVGSLCEAIRRLWVLQSMVATFVYVDPNSQSDQHAEAYFCVHPSLPLCLSPSLCTHLHPDTHTHLYREFNHMWGKIYTLFT